MKNCMADYTSTCHFDLHLAGRAVSSDSDEAVATYELLITSAVP